MHSSSALSSLILLALTAQALPASAPSAEAPTPLAKRSGKAITATGDTAWTLAQLSLASEFSVKMGDERLKTAERPWQTWRASVLSEIAEGSLTLKGLKTTSSSGSKKTSSTKKASTSTKKSTKKTTSTKKTKTTTTKSTKSTKASSSSKKSTKSIRPANTVGNGAAQQTVTPILAQSGSAPSSSTIIVTSTTTTTVPTTTSKTTTTKKTTTTTKKTTTSTKKATTTTKKSPYTTLGGSYWAQPTAYASLTEWKDGFIDGTFAWGSTNLAVVQGPSQAEYNITLAGQQNLTYCNTTLLQAIDENYGLNYTEGQSCPGNSTLTQAATIVNDTESAIQVKYPVGSYAPSRKPVGGVGAYSDRLEIASEQNMTMTYSVFFPLGFDFVKGGKLPGMYGGKHGCSGGNVAEDCFSARMMFRTGGMGELYLYAPREKQVASLCTLKPLSFCNTVYGMSIGRGAFTFKTGVWTTIRQDIWLNTPGVADGGFNIWVNDELKISNNQTYFRNGAAGNIITGTTSSNMTLIDYDALPADPDIPNGGFATLPSNLTLVDVPTTNSGVLQPSAVLQYSLATKLAAWGTLNLNLPSTTSAAVPVETITETATVYATPTANAALGLRKRERKSVDLLEKRAVFVIPGFMGIMFDTFFGGSDPSYATKKQQFSYFKRFELQINDFNPNGVNEALASPSATATATTTVSAVVPTATDAGDSD